MGGRAFAKIRQTRHCTNSALVFLSSALFFLNSTLFFLNSFISLLSQLISFLTPPFLDSAFSQLGPFPTFKERHVAGLSRHRYRSWGTTQNELIGGKTLPGLFAHLNLPYLSTHRYIKKIIQVHFLNLTQMKLSLRKPPSTKTYP